MADIGDKKKKKKKKELCFW